MNNDNAKYWMALKSINGIGNALFHPLLARFGLPEAVLSANLHALTAVEGISKKTAAAIASFDCWEPILRQLKTMNETGIKMVTCLDHDYPRNLLHIYDRPAFLYVRGCLSPHDTPVALVGSRHASTYGKYTTERLSRELALRGITIVSGMARGIDSCAHRGALTAKGRTIAVLGSGLDVIYPPENKKLFQEISENGAVISEYPPGTQPLAYQFPARNRIISGISHGVVVVEAGEKSGSLITARLAMEQGRDVFAIPGAIDSPTSRGTNSLIKQGAKLIENVDDILEDILPQLERPPDFPPCHETQTASVSSTQDDLKGNTAPPGQIAQTIVKILANKKMHADEIIDQTDLPTAEVLSNLITLELRGIVIQHPGNFFSLKK
jgi:DNA processing protein